MPGTARHRALLRSIVETYEHDERVLAIGVLGSLARGTWDEWSDLDLLPSLEEFSIRYPCGDAVRTVRRETRRHYLIASSRSYLIVAIGAQHHLAVVRVGPHYGVRDERLPPHGRVIPAITCQEGHLGVHSVQIVQSRRYGSPLGIRSLY